MRLTVKTFSAPLVVSVDTPTVEAVKMALCEQKPEWAPERLKLVYHGRILTDQTEDLTFVGEDGFIVAMASRATPRTPASAVTGAQSTSTPPAAAADPSATSQSEAVHDSEHSAPPAAVDAPAPSPTNDGTAALDTLLGMGFDRTRAHEALHEASGDVNLAASRLLRSGRVQNTAARLRAAMERRRANDLVAQLTSDPARLQMLQRMPEVQHLLASSPLLSGIASRPEELQRLLAHVLTNQEFQLAVKERRATPEMIAAAMRPSEGGEQMASPSAGRVAPASTASAAAADTAAAAAQRSAAEAQVASSPEDLAAIERLQQLGFSRAAVLEAFLVCDRDENAAANYLFDH